MPRPDTQYARTRLAGAVIVASPLRLTIVGQLLAFTLVAALIFASLASYSRRETVRGWVVPAGGLVRVAAPAGGVLVELNVREGDVVAAGAQIGRLQLLANAFDGQAGSELISSLNAEAEADRRRAEAGAARLEMEVESIRRERDGLAAQVRDAVHQVELQETRLGLARAQVARVAPLAERGFFPRAQLESMEAAALLAENELLSARQRQRQLATDLSVAQARLRAAPLTREESASVSVAERAQIHQRLAEARARTEFVVRAPLAGRIGALPTRLGQSLAQGAGIATVIPTDSSLRAELYIPSRAAGFVRSGQEVRLRYEAFPHQRFGSGDGRVISVSRTIISPADVAIPGLTLAEPVFQAQVDLSREYVSAYGDRIPLQAGMLLTADVVLDRRSLLEWLFDPLYAAARK